MTSRREPSQRAQARSLYRSAAARGSVSPSEHAAGPLPDPPTQAREGIREAGGDAQESGGNGEEGHGNIGERAGREGRELTLLTQRVRALYEESVVPVREIARIAGVTERTIYRYVHKGAWRRRYACAAREAAVAAANRGRSMATEPDFGPVKGAGGRFIRREDEGKPYACGLKALDPAGARRAVAACVRAEELPDDAIAQASADAQVRAEELKAEREAEAYLKSLKVLLDALVDIARQRVKRRARPNPDADRLSWLLERALIGCLERMRPP
jgi:AcrR family transcriptional regulator